MNLKTYQWVKGDNAGKVVKTDGTTVFEGNLEYMFFTDGSRCNANLLNDYIIEIAGEEDLVLLNEVAPVPITRINQTAQREIAQSTKPEVLSNDPVATLLSSSKKKKQKITLTIDVEVPPTDLIKIVAASFENGLLKVEDYLEKLIDDNLQASIKKQIASQVILEVFGTPQKTLKEKKNEKVQSIA